jgi:hypothetical protein
MRLFVVFFRWGIFVCAPCVVYMFLPVLMMLELPLLVHQFVYSIPGRLGNNFVPVLFLICVLFLFGYFNQFHGCFLL